MLPDAVFPGRGTAVAIAVFSTGALVLNCFGALVNLLFSHARHRT